VFENSELSFSLKEQDNCPPWTPLEYVISFKHILLYLNSVDQRLALRNAIRDSGLLLH
jgi:hypothetical protein